MWPVSTALFRKMPFKGYSFLRGPHTKQKIQINRKPPKKVFKMVQPISIVAMKDITILLSSYFWLTLSVIFTRKFICFSIKWSQKIRKYLKGFVHEE